MERHRYRIPAADERTRSDDRRILRVRHTGGREQDPRIQERDKAWLDLVASNRRHVDNATGTSRTTASRAKC